MGASVEQVASGAVHEANRALSSGSQPSWDAAKPYQREATRAGVRAILKDPSLTPADLHESWRKKLEARGWRLGPKKDEAKKTHPSLVPYGRLPADQKQKDVMFKAVTLAVADSLKTAGEKPRGIYKGKPANPDTVKKVVDFQGITIRLDRPKGFMMLGKDSSGKAWSRKYQYDYGYIPKTLGGDGDGLDVFIGPNAKAQQAFWAIQRKPDGTFDEYKVFLGFDRKEDAQAAYAAHIPKKLLGGMIVMRVNMMKAMLGQNPVESMKTAMWRGCFGALHGQLEQAL